MRERVREKSKRERGGERGIKQSEPPSAAWLGSALGEREGESQSGDMPSGRNLAVEL
jgi:hypothetical protein